MILKLRESIYLKELPEKAFDYLSDPENWPKINDKIETIVYENNRILGSICFKNKKKDFDGYLEDCHRPKFIKARLFVKEPDEESKAKIEMIVEYSFSEGIFGTKVTESIAYLGDIPFWGWIIIKIITILGKTVGETPLQKLKAELEKNS